MRVCTYTLGYSSIRTHIVVWGHTYSSSGNEMLHALLQLCCSCILHAATKHATCYCNRCSVACCMLSCSCMLQHATATDALLHAAWSAAVAECNMLLHQSMQHATEHLLQWHVEHAIMQLQQASVAVAGGRMYSMLQQAATCSVAVAWCTTSCNMRCCSSRRTHV